MRVEQIYLPILETPQFRNAGVLYCAHKQHLTSTANMVLIFSDNMLIYNDSSGFVASEYTMGFVGISNPVWIGPRQGARAYEWMVPQSTEICRQCPAPQRPLIRNDLLISHPQYMRYIGHEKGQEVVSPPQKEIRSLLGNQHRNCKKVTSHNWIFRF